jgi:uncharacterized protein YggT (Ycf19 family)
MAVIRQTHTTPVVVHSTHVDRGVFSVTRIIYYLLDVLEVALGLRFLLLLLGANPSAAFANFVYTLTAPLVAPFQGIFTRSVVNGAVFDWSTLIAMVVFALLAYGLVRLILLLTTPDDTQIIETD